MRPIVYYVASSIDGFIAGPQDDISAFLGKGNGVEAYLQDLQNYDTVIMGRKTYEFGYQYGLVPGEPAYPHMRHYIFSRSLHFARPNDQVQICDYDPDLVRSLKSASGSAIYLCGGGVFAGWLLENELIDTIRLKLNPIVMGQGIPLFAGVNKSYQLQLTDQQTYEYGLQLITYQVLY